MFLSLWPFSVRLCVCGSVDGSWEADTVQENHPLATDLFGRWQFHSNSHPASQWPWPPNISITSSSSGLPQPVTQEKERFIHRREFTHAYIHHFFSFSHLRTSHKYDFGSVNEVHKFLGYATGQSKGWEEDRFRRDSQPLIAVHKPPDTVKPLFSVVGFLHIVNQGGNADRPLDYGEQSVWCLWSGSVPLWSKMESKPCS